MKYESVGEVLAYGFKGRLVSVRYNCKTVDEMACDKCVEITIHDDKGPLTITDLVDKALQLRKEEPMRLLRKKRDELLAESDAKATRDYPHPSEGHRHAWEEYREALRRIPATSSPRLDADGELDMASVEWPEKPSNAKSYPSPAPPSSASTLSIQEKVERMQRELAELMASLPKE